MVSKIHINKYRKLIDLDLDFSKGVNAISGTNGTCKTSLMHLISNSFQAVTKNCDWLNEPKCLDILKSINSITNPKVESLTRGDKKYNDPANGVTGTLFTVDYFNRPSLNFRKHNSKILNRYAIKPKYQVGTKDSLPHCPVIYLGLSRLVPFGEYKNDEAVTGIKKKLPIEYQNELTLLYKSFTNYNITYGASQQMGDIKVRADFDCDVEGVDSNTISAGEDNLLIILTALISLKYYYENINSSKNVESLLLIDEMDASLHPAYQIKLLQLFQEYSAEYKIQIIFTTHSLTLLEAMLRYKNNVVYLLDNITSVNKMIEPDIYKIKMHLQSLTQDDIYLDKVIPIFAEDDEARFLFDEILNYFLETHPDEFRGVRAFFHMVHANIGSEVLTAIFTDSKLLRTTMRSICIIDGDHSSNLENCIIALPGNESPETVLFSYSSKLYDEDSSFWNQPIIVDKGYGKLYYIEKLKNPIDQFETQIKDAKAEGKSTKGMRREFNKKLFNENRTFIELLIKHWLHNPSNQESISKFYNNLKALFKKVAHYHEINPNEWQ